jgi:DNA-binding CsgD family transcriptional regulator/tetratricopeptide (TPR) repeat protein
MRAVREDSAAFVGRGAELARLRRAWDSVRGGRSELVLAGGEAGVGKTRLMRQFVSGITPSSVRVLWGECIDLHEGGLPYAPFRQALRSSAADQADTVFAGAVRAAGPDLAMLLPSLGDAGATIDDEQIRRVRLFEALFDLLRRLGAHKPVLFVIEDAHWADDTTLDLVTFLSRNLSDSPILLLLTFRPDLVGANPAVREFLASRAGRTVTDQFTVNGFEEHELADYLAQLIDAEPRPAFVTEVARRSNGNPLFVQEIIAADRAGTGVPPSLKQLLLSRTTGLPAEVRNVLRIAAVAGHAIPYDVLQTVSGRSPAELTKALRHAIDADVLVEDPTIGGYAFRHALLQEALYSDLLVHERQALHHSYANALLGRSNDEPLVMGAVAAHWDKAGDLERALPAYVKAAEAAKQAFSFADVERYLSRAYELWSDVPDAEALTFLSHRHLANRLIDAAVMVEDDTAAVAVARDALAMVDAARDRNATAVQRGQLSRALWFNGEETKALDEILAAVELLDDEPSVEHARVLAWRAMLVAFHGGYRDSRALAELTLDTAIQAGAPRTYRSALATYGSVLARQGELDRGWRFIDDAELLARKRTDADEIMRIFLLRGRVLQAYGRWADARDNYAEGISEAAKYGMTRRYVWRFHVLAARMLFLQGRWDDATAEIYQAREHTAGRQAALPPLLIATGEFDTAAEFFARQPTRWRSDGTGLLQIPEGPVELAVWQGQFPEARERYEHGLRLVAGSEELMPEARLCVAALHGEADAVASAPDGADEGTLARATELIRRLRSLGAARPPRPDGFGNVLAALVAAGEAEYLRLRGSNRPNAWADAARRWDDLEMPYPAAYARMRQGEAMLAQGDTTRAQELLASADATAAALGAAPLSEAVRAAQTAAGIATPVRTDGDRGAARDTTSAFGLTEREREVAGVLAQGLSNREIAERLFIAEGTASVHVSRILRKLGVTSRGQAIALLLTDPMVTSDQDRDGTPA